MKEELRSASRSFRWLQDGDEKAAATASSAQRVGAIPGGFGQAGNDRIPRVIIGGGIECGHGEVSTIGKGDNADVVSRGGDWLARASPTSPHN